MELSLLNSLAWKSDDMSCTNLDELQILYFAAKIQISYAAFLKQSF